MSIFSTSLIVIDDHVAVQVNVIISYMPTHTHTVHTTIRLHKRECTSFQSVQSRANYRVVVGGDFGAMLFSSCTQNAINSEMYPLC